MVFKEFLDNAFISTESAHLAFLAIGFMSGLVLAAFIFSIAAHKYSKRMFQWRVLDELRRELRDPMAAYVEWLHAVTAEFSVWKGDFLARFLPNNANDQYELNRLRRLYVDPRCQIWFNRLREYDPVLGNFKPEVTKLWANQSQLLEQFHTVFRLLDQNPLAAAKAGHVLENLAFEQSQQVTTFLNFMQYECLKTVANSKPSPGKKPLVVAIPKSNPGALHTVRPHSDFVKLASLS